MRKNLRKFIVLAILLSLSPTLMAQVPGSDYGPAGWSAALAQPELSCYDLGLLAASFGLAAFIPGMSGIFGFTAANLAFLYAAVCG